MKLLEFEAKQLLKNSGITIPESELAASEVSILPAVIKSQVFTGGRGKAGGVVIVKNKSEAEQTVANLKKLPIKGEYPTVLLAEELLDIERELYLSIMISRDTSSIDIMAHPVGGVDIESQERDKFFKKTIQPESINSIGESLAELYDLEDKTFALQELLKSLYDCFIQNDATLLEINPLILTKSGQLVAADCKMELDSSARFRHPDWNFTDNGASANFVTLHQQGSVATVANGAGLAMATVDAVEAAGLLPANFLDIGGGASTESTLKAFREIMTYPNVKVIVINIFAGITRCDQIAQAIVEAKKQIPHLPPLCIKLAGTNFEQAKLILDKENIPLQSSLEDCLELAKEYCK